MSLFRYSPGNALYLEVRYISVSLVDKKSSDTVKTLEQVRYIDPFWKHRFLTTSTAT